jgi:hypothetical protein
MAVPAEARQAAAIRREGMTNSWVQRCIKSLHHQEASNNPRIRRRSSRGRTRRRGSG